MGAKTGLNLFPDIGRDAVFSPCKRYRYRLTREWGPGDKVGFLMLNPSTADCSVDDPTIRRCIRFASSWGFDGIEVCNLFAWRATDPLQLRSVTDPVGPENDEYLHQLPSRVRIMVVAWGNFRHDQDRADQVLGRLPECDMRCLGQNNNLSPRHPLYVPANAPLMEFSRDQFWARD